MKIISKIKKKSIIALVMGLTLIFSSIAPVYAEETATASSTSAESKTDEEAKEEQEADKEDNKERDYTFSTTTKGNSELIANQEVLLENGYHQFIAVETRDGDIFYIIIDKTKTEDNVYFLNEVDTYDINKLLSDDDGESGGNNTAIVEEETTEPTEATTAIEQENSSSDSSFMLILVVGICLLGGIGFAIFKLSKGKKKPVADDDFLMDEDDDEINEDKEGTL